MIATLTGNEITAHVQLLLSGDANLDQFEDWFRTNSRGMFAECAEILDAFLAIDAAFSELRYGNMTLAGFRVEIVNAISPLRR